LKLTGSSEKTLFGAIGFLVFAQLLVALFRIGDVVLSWAHTLNIIPYGVLWVIVNPLYWQTRFYNLYTFGISMIGLLLQLYFWRKGRLSVLWIFAAQATNFIFVWQLNGQSVSVLMFAPLVTIYPWLISWELLTKLPIGWSLNGSDPHFQCAFVSKLMIGDVEVCGHFSHLSELSAYTESYAFFLYFILGLWLIVPLLFWAKNYVANR